MIYKRYHTALVFILVLQHLLKDTKLEEKAFNLYADILELEQVPKHQINRPTYTPSALYKLTMEGNFASSHYTIAETKANN